MSLSSETVAYTLISLADKFQEFFYGDSNDVTFSYKDTDGTIRTKTVPNVNKIRDIVEEAAHDAEPNVQVDWNETDTTKDEYIKNKPDIAEIARDTLGSALNAGDNISITVDDDNDTITIVASTNQEDVEDIVSNLIAASNSNVTITYDDDNGVLTIGIDIVDNLTSTDTDKSLSANQGRVLKGLVDKITYNYVEKDADYTATVNDFVLCDTVTNGSWTLTLPDSPENYEFVALLDIKTGFKDNPLTVARNGKLIMGLDEDMVVDTDNASIELIYINGDWRIK